jgi:hypothetical protein
MLQRCGSHVACLHTCRKHSNHTRRECLPDLADNNLADQGTLLGVQAAVGWVALKVVREVQHILCVLGTQGAEWAPCIYCKGLVHYLVASLEMADCLRHLDCTYN